MISASDMRGNAPMKRRKKTVTLATVKSLATDLNALHATIDTLAESMKQNGFREVEFDGLITINNAVNQLGESFLKLQYSVERLKKLR